VNSRRLGAQRWFPVLRNPDVDDAVATGLACQTAGLDVIELTWSTPDVTKAVEQLAAAGARSVGLGTQLGTAASVGGAEVTRRAAAISSGLSQGDGGRGRTRA
jgi:2-keto-3-deoxy-6-phosphogluconate aldolase